MRRFPGLGEDIFRVFRVNLEQKFGTAMQNDNNDGVTSRPRDLIMKRGRADISGENFCAGSLYMIFLTKKR
jgi:hypothetical protein